MLTAHRKRLLLDRLARDGHLVAKQLSAELGLSEDTLRRDLRELAAEGLLQRVHGGALPASPTVVGLAERRLLAPDAKRALGKAGADMIVPGSSVIFDGGTTNLEIVRHLPGDLAFLAITHSPEIATALEPFPKVEVVLVGGRLYRHSMVCVGAMAVEAIGRLRADLFFLGLTGVHPGEGLSTGDMEEAAVKRLLMSRAAETVALATNDKLGAISAFQVAPLADLAGLIVEPAAPQTVVEQLAAAGLDVRRAAASAPTKRAP